MSSSQPINSASAHRYALRSSSSDGAVTNSNTAAASSVGDRVSTRRRSSIPAAPLTNSNMKTPATRKRARPESGTKVNDESGVKEPIATMPRPEKCDFRVNLLRPPKITPNPVPRFKRKYVSEPDKCLDIVEPVLNMCYEQEDRYATTDNFFDAQPFVSSKMRAILADWLVDVCKKMRLDPPTLWLTMSIVDRTLQKVVFRRSRLQLLGIAALSLACKMEEVYIASPRDFVYITDGAYNCTELLEAELQVLEALNYEVHVPTAYHFLIHYLELIHASDVSRMLALYYAERSLLYDCARCKPTLFAAAALCAALLWQTSQTDQCTCSDLPTEDVHDHLELCKAAALSEREAKNPRPEQATPSFSFGFGDFFFGGASDPTANFLTQWVSQACSTSTSGSSEAAAADSNEQAPQEELPVFAVGPHIVTTARLWGLGPITVRGALPGFKADIEKHSEVLEILGPRAKRRLLARLKALMQLPAGETTASAVETGALALQEELQHIDTAEIHTLAATMIRNVRREKEPDGRVLDAVKRKFSSEHHCCAVATLSVPSEEYVSATLGIPLPAPEPEVAAPCSAQTPPHEAPEKGSKRENAASAARASKRRK